MPLSDYLQCQTVINTKGTQTKVLILYTLQYLNLLLKYLTSFFFSWSYDIKNMFCKIHAKFWDEGFNFLLFLHYDVPTTRWLKTYIHFGDWGQFMFIQQTKYIIDLYIFTLWQLKYIVLPDMNLYAVWDLLFELLK